MNTFYTYICIHARWTFHIWYIQNFCDQKYILFCCIISLLILYAQRFLEILSISFKYLNLMLNYLTYILGNVLCEKETFIIYTRLLKSPCADLFPKYSSSSLQMIHAKLHTYQSCSLDIDRVRGYVNAFAT